MTDQIPEKLTNNYARADLTGLNLYAIITGEPRSNQSRSYEFKTAATPVKGKNSSALWRGFVSTYVLWQTGKLTLEKFEYPFHRGRLPDIVYEELQGDFWLVMRSSFLGKTTYVPFRDGTIVEDQSRWISVDDNEIAVPSQKKTSTFPYLPSFKTNLMQSLVLVFGLLLLVCSFLFIPYEATYIQRGENSRSNVGYHLVFNPPKPTEACVRAFGLRAGGRSAQAFSNEVNMRCYLKPLLPQTFLAVASVIAVSLALFLFLGIFTRSPIRSQV